MMGTRVQALNPGRLSGRRGPRKVDKKGVPSQIRHREREHSAWLKEPQQKMAHLGSHRESVGLGSHDPVKVTQCTGICLDLPPLFFRYS